MDARTIREARRVIHDLIFGGKATLSTGLELAPKPEFLVPLFERIAGKKLEEVQEAPGVTGFTPPTTHHVREAPDVEADEA